jgi:Bacteriophage probable baseplate hub protein
MTSTLIHSSAPVFTVDGEVKGALARDISHLEIDEATDGLRTMRLRLIAVGPRESSSEEEVLYLDGSDVDFGKEIKVSVGPPDDERIVFLGKISAIEASFTAGEDPHVVVFAEDSLMKLRMVRRCKTYENMSDADIASAIASENGLTGDVDADGPTYKVVQQWNQSDLAFLRERARLIQAEVWLDGSSLCFKSRGNRTGTSITLTQGNQLLDVAVRADLAHQRTSVKVSGYDASQRDKVDEEAEGSVVQSETSGGRTGPSILEQAFGERATFRVRNVPLESGEAQAWAKAEMLRRARGFVTVAGTTAGTPDMQVGSTLKLDNIGKPFSGDGYYVTRLRHTYDLDSGHRTHFEAERATVNDA